MKNIKTYLVLCRIPISFFAACSALTAYLLTPDRSVSTIIALAAGVFLLASGASALNQFQERDIDALMKRTRRRPLPRRTIAPGKAVTLAIGLIVCGILLLGMIAPAVAVLGAFAVLWYNGLYTPLKRKTAFAAVPGALVGALPPVMGWSAGGGDLADPRIFALAALFFLWQIPHFWLLLLTDRDDHEAAGLPSLNRVFPRERLAGMAVLWAAAASVAGLALPLYGVAASQAGQLLFIVLALWMTASGLAMLRKHADAASARNLFRNSNVFLMLVMILISLDAVLRRG